MKRFHIHIGVDDLEQSIEFYSVLLGSDPTKKIAAKHRTQKGGHILFRPVGQEAFVRALRILLDRKVPMQQGIEALASTQLILNQAPWSHVMWDPNRNAMNRTNLQLAESLLLHMVHENPADPEFPLEKNYQTVVGNSALKIEDIPKGEPAKRS